MSANFSERFARVLPLLLTAFLVMLGGTGGRAVPAVAATQSVAIVVGVNDYPQLTGADLKGCVNDAAAMRARLEKYGFAVTYLPDASKAAIVSAIGAARAQPLERFVFFFAGHGTRLSSGDGALMPSDANVKTEYSLLSATELYDLVSAVPAASRSVILDSCHSGAMMRSKALLPPGTRARFYDFEAEAARWSRARYGKGVIKRPDESPLGASDGEGLMVAPEAGAAPRVCYYVACDSQQVALETTTQDVAHGYFTRFLTAHLDGQKTRWRDANSYVTGQMSGLRQRPQLTSYFASRAVFDLPGAPAASPQDAWALFNDALDAPEKLRLELVPQGGWMGGEKGLVSAGQSLSFDAILGTEGYLMMLEYGTSGNLNLLWPETMNAADAYAPQNTRIPQSGFVYQFDEPGFEELRVLLFKNREDAQMVLDALRASFSDVAGRKVSPANRAKLRAALQSRQTSRGVRLESGAEESGFYSSSLTVTVAAP